MKVKFPIPKVFFFLLVFSITFMIFSSSFFNVLYDDQFIKDEYKKLGNRPVAEPALKTQEIIAYFNTEAEYVDDSTVIFADLQFTQDELEHYKDVKDVIQGIRIWYFISFVIFFVLLIGFLLVLFLEYRDHNDKKLFSEKMSLFFIKIQMTLLVVSGGILVVLGAFSLFAFRRAFVVMHKIFFEDGTWTFPADTLSAALFPEQFFNDFWMAVLKQVGLFIVMLLFLFGLMYTLYVLKKQQRKK